MARSPSTGKRIVWSQHSNLNIWDGTEKDEWKQYSDLENEFIEEKYQQKQPGQTELNDYLINFKEMAHFKKNDRDKQRKMKREELPVTQLGAREERFCPSQEIVKSFVPEEEFKFIKEWGNCNAEIQWNMPETVEHASQGNLNIFLFHPQFRFCYFLFRYFERRKTVETRIGCRTNG
jgi:hypothetical protein